MTSGGGVASEEASTDCAGRKRWRDDWAGLRGLSNDVVQREIARIRDGERRLTDRSRAGGGSLRRVIRFVMCEGTRPRRHERKTVSRVKHLAFQPPSPGPASLGQIADVLRRNLSRRNPARGQHMCLEAAASAGRARATARTSAPAKESTAGIRSTRRRQWWTAAPGGARIPA